jgi:predicted alpha/beta hydrolase family esterase
MNDIAGIPYVEAEFDKDGTLKTAVVLPAGVTDIAVISHGWNNNNADAEGLYQRLFTNFANLDEPDLQGRSLAIVGVVWPSKQFDEMVAAVAANESAQGSASLQPEAQSKSDAMLAEKLDSMAEFFGAAHKQTLAELKALIPDLSDKGSARKQFVEKVRSLLDSSAANAEDASTAFFKEDGNELMKVLQVDEEDVDPKITSDGGSASLPLGVGAVAPPTGGAAGFLSFLSGIKGGAMNILNFATYFEMKSRAGTVGKNGVAPLIDKLSPQVQRIHLIGHSFGGRVVTSAALNSTTDKIRSMSLLQTAFSHNGFSKTKNGFFRDVVDKNRVHGPILVTHTANDKAVGIAYPVASRINRETAANLGDKNDKFGGLGRNGAQQMEDGEVIEETMLPAGSTYQFQSGKFHNLLADQFIPSHSGITGKEVAYAVRTAIAG